MISVGFWERCNYSKMGSALKVKKCACQKKILSFKSCTQLGRAAKMKMTRVVSPFTLITHLHEGHIETRTTV